MYASQWPNTLVHPASAKVRLLLPEGANSQRPCVWEENSSQELCWYTDSYTGTEGNPVNRRSLKRQRSIRSKETQWKSVASGGQPTQVRIQALEPRAEQIQTVGTENVKTPISLSRF